MPDADILRESAPVWATPSPGGSSIGFDVRAQPLLRGGGQGRAYDLRVAAEDGTLVVREQLLGSHLPSACPERHINSDGSFCIGLNAGTSVCSVVEAQKWWQLLAEYLGCQQIADKYGRWPPEYGLSHGHAALYQIEMEKIAVALGWENEVSDAIAFGAGWLGGALPRIRQGTHMLVNQRARCPRPCECNRSPFLRRNCLHRDDVARLVNFERMRRKEEAGFIEGFRKKNFTCCETMKKCPFRPEKEGAYAKLL